MASFALASQNVREGHTCLQVGSQYGPVSANQTVAVQPGSRYRLTGWIRFESPQAEPGAVPAQATEGAGASLGLLNLVETSEVISTTTDWKQVTLEFTTTETETTIAPCIRFGRKGQQITGTAWFDELKLERVQ